MKNEAGNSYGRWTVISTEPYSEKPVSWLCRCTCGTKGVVRGDSLRSGNSKSCGCLRKEKLKEPRKKPNRITISRAGAHIHLPGGKTALIDTEDVDLIAQMRWRLSCGGRYVQSTGRDGKIFLHRILLATKNTHKVVDHINGDTLDNRKSNLQLCSQSSNIQKGRRKVGACGYIGVTQLPAGAFRAQISIHNKSVHLGVFQNAKEAAEAYNKAAFAQHGPHAKLNHI